MQATLRTSLFDALDRPARSALLLQARPLWVTAGIGLGGAALVAAASLSSLALDGLQFGRAILPRADLVRAAFEALLVVVPSATLLSAYFRIALSPRVIVASLAIGLFAAGLVALATLPLMAFLTLFSRATPLLAPGAMLPIVALIATAGVSERIIRAIDPSRRARVFLFGFHLVLAAVFVVRLKGL